MKTTNISIIEASEGCWLCETTEGLDVYTYSKRVVNPQEGAWREVTEEEKAAIEAECAARIAAKEAEAAADESTDTGAGGEGDEA